VLYRAVVALEQLHATLQRLLADYAPDRLLIGAGTGAKRLRAQLREWFPNAVWETVAERDTTLRARELYFQYHPPRGWRRLLPKGMRIPPNPTTTTPRLPSFSSMPRHRSGYNRGGEHGCRLRSYSTRW
jgi:hypothetical protein